MFADWFSWFFLVGCVGAVICAAHSAKDGRWQAVGLACLILVNLVLFEMSWTDYAPNYALQRIGIETTSIHLWMISDALIGCVSAWVAYEYWWGKGLLLIAFIQMGIHAQMDDGLISGDLYVNWLLKAPLLMQIAIFFTIGARGGLDSVRHRINGLLRHSALPAFGKAKKQEAP